jgi:alpha-beta hydrolase superfamily lysophospholipase
LTNAALPATGRLFTPTAAFSRPVFAKFWRPIAVTALILGLLLASSTWIHLDIPTLTGEHAVGRQEFVWTDPLRPEPRTGDPADHRQTGLVVWYPAHPETGSPAPYVPALDAIKAGLVASGEFNSIEVAGLGWVRSHSFADAGVDSSTDRYPLLVLSPGNATNVEFYGSLAEDLASNGYVVVGLNHPFQVTAMSLTDGSVAVYDTSTDADPVAAKIAERVADVEFVLNRLGQEIAARTFLDGRVDLSRVGVLGHSNGGLTAAEVCRASTAVSACMNIDGQAASGPFGTAAEPAPVGHPFMYLTKEPEIHPALAATFELSGTGTFRVVVPEATHDQFADGPLFQPGLWPLDRTADQVQTVTRGFARAFFDQFLGHASPQTPGNLALPIVDATDVYLYGYPLGINQPQ